MTKAAGHGRSHTDRIVLEQCFGQRRVVAERPSASRSSVRVRRRLRDDQYLPRIDMAGISDCAGWVASLGACMTRLGITKSTVTQMTRIKPPEGIFVPWLRASWISGGLAGT